MSRLINLKIYIINILSFYCLYYPFIVYMNNNSNYYNLFQLIKTRLDELTKNFDINNLLFRYDIQLIRLGEFYIKLYDKSVQLQDIEDYIKIYFNDIFKNFKYKKYFRNVRILLVRLADNYKNAGHIYISLPIDTNNKTIKKREITISGISDNQLDDILAQFEIADDLSFTDIYNNTYNVQFVDFNYNVDAQSVNYPTYTINLLEV